MGKKRGLTQEYSYTESEDSFAISFTDKYHAISYNNGNVKIFHTKTGRMRSNIDIHPIVDGEIETPVTSINWKKRESEQDEHILVACSCDGTVSEIRGSTGKILGTRSLETEIYCSAVRGDGKESIYAGKNSKIHIYNEQSGTTATMVGGSNNATAGHSSRIFSVKYHPSDPFTIISGGWDNTIQIWDSRVGYAVRSIFDVFICGDSLDINAKNELLAGSHRRETPLELYDFGTGKKIRNLNFTNCHIYAAKFSPNGEFYAAGGSRFNQMKLFNAQTHQVIGMAENLGKGVFSLDFSPTSDRLGAACGTAGVYDISQLN